MTQPDAVSEPMPGCILLVEDDAMSWQLPDS